MNTPTHVGFILDGNRRYAQSKSLSTIKGHEAGAQALEKILRHLENSTITQVTLYAFSTENFNRTKEEVDGLMELFTKSADKLFSSKEANKTNTQIRFIGNKKLFTKKIQEQMNTIEKETAQNTKRKINVGFGYGGRDEITRAVQKIVEKKITHVSEDVISQHLDLSDGPDLIIRTGGVCRTSNFLAWQSVYSEWFFIDKFWPEFTPDDMDHVLEEFTNRKRRFGK